MKRALAMSCEMQPKSASAIVSPRWFNIRYRNSGSINSFRFDFDTNPIRHNIKPETDIPIVTMPNINNLITYLIAVCAAIGHVQLVHADDTHLVRVHAISERAETDGKSHLRF